VTIDEVLIVENALVGAVDEPAVGRVWQLRPRHDDGRLGNDLAAQIGGRDGPSRAVARALHLDPAVSALVTDTIYPLTLLAAHLPRRGRFPSVVHKHSPRVEAGQRHCGAISSNGSRNGSELQPLSGNWLEIPGNFLSSVLQAT